ncbi:MAG: hypothetical protein NXY57DRAFT_966429 [Lentinula lateritia]|nr:MAG: hypothetical protein NXY57DRAFT_966429 [Lentinula lateritia]
MTPFSSCDIIDLDGKAIATTKERSTYTHAQKMRAAATFGFGRVHGLVSAVTQSGDTPTSARAVTSALLENLYYFNRKPEFREPQLSSPPTRKGQLGPRAHSMMNCGYNFSFCGLLCVDEMLKIQLQDINLSDDPKTGQLKLSLHLPFRKTSQFGDIKPFVWYEMPEEYQHICVVQAFVKWILISGLTEGYLFRKIRANDRLAEENEPMVCFETSEQFLEMFRNNLLDIGVDFVPYGTHSF